MPRKVKPNKAVAEPDDVVITEAMLARAKRREDLPPEIERLLPRRRGPSKKPAKVALTLRISRPVVEAFRATGDGWQTRINDALELAAKRLPAQDAR
jgi:uncharacterized protein (DUF4415 family)